MNNQDEERNMGSALWQSQELESPRISLEYVRFQATKLNAERRRHLGSMYALVGTVILVVVAAFLLPSVKAPALVYVARITTVLLLLCSVYLLIQARRGGKSLAIRDDDKVATSLEAYRAELQRRRDLYFAINRWRSIWPTLPPVIVLFIGELFYDPLPHRLTRLWLL
jgi:hypothetical protein